MMASLSFVSSKHRPCRAAKLQWWMSSFVFCSLLWFLLFSFYFLVGPGAASVEAIVLSCCIRELGAYQHNSNVVKKGATLRWRQIFMNEFGMLYVACSRLLLEIIC